MANSSDRVDAVISPVRTVLMRTPRVFVALAPLLITIAGTVQGQDVIDGYAAHSFAASDGTVMPYRLFTPRSGAGGSLPLIVFLHGGGGRGTENVRQLSGGSFIGTRLFVSPEWQARQPAFVVAPQRPSPHSWAALDSDELAPYGSLVVELVETLLRQHNIDPDRVYLTGGSGGGVGTWDIASKRTHLFAAAVPKCGRGTPSRADALRDLPIWAFHGSEDSAVPVSGSRDMVTALRALGAPVRYTEYPGLGHPECRRFYLEPGLADWLFQQRRQR